MNDFHGYFEISQAFLEIDERFKSMHKFVPKTAYDMQILSIFSQYMVVFIARTLEGSVKNIIFTKCIINKKTKEELTEITKELKKFQNPNKEKIYKIFDDILSIKLKDEFFTNEHFTALGQIIRDRHMIAHSTETLQAIQSMKSLTDIEKHYNEIKLFVSKLCDIALS